MLRLDNIAPILPVLQTMKAGNNHLGILRGIADVLEDADLSRSIQILEKLAQHGITKDLRPLRDLLYRVTMDQARAKMTADAFHAVWMAS